LQQFVVVCLFVVVVVVFVVNVIFYYYYLLLSSFRPYTAATVILCSIYNLRVLVQSIAAPHPHQTTEGTAAAKIARPAQTI